MNEYVFGRIIPFPKADNRPMIMSIDELMKTIIEPIIPDEPTDNDEAAVVYGGITYGIPEIVDVMFKNKATIIKWADGTKTCVVCGENETYDKYTGFMAAVCKKMFGSTGVAKKLMDEKNLSELAAKAHAEQKKAEKEAREAQIKEEAALERELIKQMAEDMRLEMLAKRRAKRMIAAEDARNAEKEKA